MCTDTFHLSKLEITQQQKKQRKKNLHVRSIFRCWIPFNQYELYFLSSPFCDGIRMSSTSAPCVCGHLYANILCSIWMESSVAVAWLADVRMLVLYAITSAFTSVLASRLLSTAKAIINLWTPPAGSAGIYHTPCAQTNYQYFVNGSINTENKCARICLECCINRGNSDEPTFIDMLGPCKRNADHAISYIDSLCNAGLPSKNIRILWNSYIQ